MKNNPLFHEHKITEISLSNNDHQSAGDEDTCHLFPPIVILKFELVPPTL